MNQARQILRQNVGVLSLSPLIIYTLHRHHTVRTRTNTLEYLESISSVAIQHVQSGGIVGISVVIRKMMRDALSFYELSELYSPQDRA
jgi:hypothetical protein